MPGTFWKNGQARRYSQSSTRITWQDTPRSPLLPSIPGIRLKTELIAPNGTSLSDNRSHAAQFPMSASKYYKGGKIPVGGDHLSINLYDFGGRDPMTAMVEETPELCLRNLETVPGHPPLFSKGTATSHSLGRSCCRCPKRFVAGEGGVFSLNSGGSGRAGRLISSSFATSFRPALAGSSLRSTGASAPRGSCRGARPGRHPQGA